MPDEYTRIAIEVAVLEEVTSEAEKVAHQKLPYGRSIAWLLGEYKRLKNRVARLERLQSPQPQESVSA